MAEEGITVTSSAATAIKAMGEKEGKPSLALRLGVKGGGCAGFSYQLEQAESPSPKDLIFEQEGAKVFMDERCLPYLKGMELDYENTLMFKGFKFKNPNADSLCGCGTSFSVKKDEETHE